MGNPEKDIEQKLHELELQLKETPETNITASQKRTDVSASSDDQLESDLYITIGSGLLLVGIMMFFHSIRVSVPMMVRWFGWGQAGMGLLVIPLIIGLGIVMYDYKNRIGWVVTGASCAVIFFAMLSQLVMTFASTSLLGLVMMLLPLAGGAALIARGMSQKRNTVKAIEKRD